MTDKYRVTELLKRLNIPYSEHVREGEIHIDIEVDLDKVKGYAGFMTTYAFTVDGDFKFLDIYE